VLANAFDVQKQRGHTTIDGWRTCSTGNQATATDPCKASL